MILKNDIADFTQDYKAISDSKNSNQLFWSDGSQILKMIKKLIRVDALYRQHIAVS